MSEARILNGNEIREIFSYLGSIAQQYDATHAGSSLTELVEVEHRQCKSNLLCTAEDLEVITLQVLDSDGDGYVTTYDDAMSTAFARQGAHVVLQNYFPMLWKRSDLPALENIENPESEGSEYEVCLGTYCFDGMPQHSFSLDGDYMHHDVALLNIEEDGIGIGAMRGILSQAHDFYGITTLEAGDDVVDVVYDWLITGGVTVVFAQPRELNPMANLSGLIASRVEIEQREGNHIAASVTLAQDLTLSDGSFLSKGTKMTFYAKSDGRDLSFSETLNFTLARMAFDHCYHNRAQVRGMIVADFVSFDENQKITKIISGSDQVIQGVQCPFGSWVFFHDNGVPSKVEEYPRFKEGDPRSHNDFNLMVPVKIYNQSGVLLSTTVETKANPYLPIGDGL